MDVHASYYYDNMMTCYIERWAGKWWDIGQDNCYLNLNTFGNDFTGFLEESIFLNSHRILNTIAS